MQANALRYHSNCPHVTTWVHIMLSSTFRMMWCDHYMMQRQHIRVTTTQWLLVGVGMEEEEEEERQGALKTRSLPQPEVTRGVSQSQARRPCTETK